MLWLHDSRHRESSFGARSRFRSGRRFSMSNERFGYAQSRIAADKGISPPVISICSCCDCRMLVAWVARFGQVRGLHKLWRRPLQVHAGERAALLPPKGDAWSVLFLP